MTCESFYVENAGDIVMWIKEVVTIQREYRLGDLVPTDIPDQFKETIAFQIKLN